MSWRIFVSWWAFRPWFRDNWPRWQGVPSSWWGPSRVPRLLQPLLWRPLISCGSLWRTASWVACPRCGHLWISGALSFPCWSSGFPCFWLRRTHSCYLGRCSPVLYLWACCFWCRLFISSGRCHQPAATHSLWAPAGTEFTQMRLASAVGLESSRWFSQLDCLSFHCCLGCCCSIRQH